MEHPVILHESPDTYIELIQATASHLRIPAVYVEKDYWVTQVLQRLNESDYKQTIVFKGGTALSKAYRIIERFSEDIDLALRHQEELGDARRKKLVKAVVSVITQDLEYQKGHPQESKHGRFRKTAHSFPTTTDSAELGQVANTILIEINALANPEPATMMPIATLIHDFLLNETNRADLVSQFQLEPFEVLVLHVERTLCEKIMGLVRAGYEKNPKADFRRRIRHFYDIAMILREQQYKDYVASDAFPNLIKDVIDADRNTMPGASAWLDPPIANAMVFADTNNLWHEISAEFHGAFKAMVYGDSIPEDKEVIAGLELIRTALLDG